ncbi:MAG: hypothetical protein WDZ79_02520 [Candidatus Paceibacterota bacterium]
MKYFPILVALWISFCSAQSVLAVSFSDAVSVPGMSVHASADNSADGSVQLYSSLTSSAAQYSITGGNGHLNIEKDGAFRLTQGIQGIIGEGPSLTDQSWRTDIDFGDLDYVHRIGFYSYESFDGPVRNGAWSSSILQNATFDSADLSLFDWHSEYAGEDRFNVYATLRGMLTGWSGGAYDVSRSYGSMLAVPEPGSAALAVLGAMCFILRPGQRHRPR